MHYGYGQTPHPAGVFHIQYGAVHVHAVGIGSVEHYEVFVVGGGLLHQSYHRDIIRVIAQSYVLYITDYHIKFGQDFGGYAAALAIVQRCYRYPRHRVDAAADMLAGIGIAAKTVFGRKYRGNVYAAFEHNIQGVAIADHSRMVGE